MKNYLFHVGVDISKLKLDVVFFDKHTPNLSEHFIVENNSRGVKSIIISLKKRKIDVTSGKKIVFSKSSIDCFLICTSFLLGHNRKTATNYQTK